MAKSEEGSLHIQKLNSSNYHLTDFFPLSQMHLECEKNEDQISTVNLTVLNKGGLSLFHDNYDRKINLPFFGVKLKQLTAFLW